MIATLSTTKLKKNKKNISYDINNLNQPCQIQQPAVENNCSVYYEEGTWTPAGIYPQGTIVRVAGGRRTPILTRTICQRMTPITSPIPIKAL